MEPLGFDRDHNEIYFFDGRGACSLVTGTGRLFCKSKSGEWGYWNTPNEVSLVVSRARIEAKNSDRFCVGGYPAGSSEPEGYSRAPAETGYRP